jgi:hypothetical protein
MILFTSSSRVNSIIMDDADFIRADLASHPMYLMSASGINSLLSYNNSSLTFSNFVMSIDLVRILCVIMPYVGTLTEASSPILPN